LEDIVELDRVKIDAVERYEVSNPSKRTPGDEEVVDEEEESTKNVLEI